MNLEGSFTLFQIVVFPKKEFKEFGLIALKTLSPVFQSEQLKIAQTASISPNARCEKINGTSFWNKILKKKLSF